MRDVKALKRIYHQLLTILTKEQILGAIVVFIAMMLCSSLELLGVSAIYPFLQLMTDSNELRNSWYGGIIYSIWPEANKSQVLIIICITLIFVYLLKNAIAILCEYIQFRYSSKFRREASITMLASYLKRPYEYFLNTNSSVMIRGIHSDVNCTYRTLLQTFGIFSQSMTILLIAIFLFSTDKFITICAMSMAVICFFGIVLGFRKPIKEAGRKTREAVADEDKCAYQTIHGIKEITVLDRKSLFINKYEEIARKYEKANTTSCTIGACPDRILEGVCIAGFMGTVCVRIIIGDVEDIIPILGTFAMAAFKILPSVAKISNHISQLISDQFGLAECYENITCARNIDKLTEERKAGSGTYNQKLLFSDRIEVKNVVWQYINTSKPVLNGASLVLKRGEAVALVGPSGQGKTTLADILMGLLVPENGEVLMDGIDILSISEEWYKIIGYVPQTPFLIDDTIEANVAFGLSKDQVDESRVWGALEKAQIADFVKKLDSGLNTFVGERGVKLSGGQRQRISIARALYNDPDIIIFDEATSALDNETESALMESIDALKGEKTMLIIAHRLTTIKNCDRAYVIDGGIAVERLIEELL